MNTVTAKFTAETLAAATPVLPLSFTCACCGDRLHRDDHMLGVPAQLALRDEAIAEFTAKFGAHVCYGCAEDPENLEGAA